MIAYNYDEAVPVTRELYWVGFYDSDANLHCNPYLLIDDKDVVLFDPGSIPHFPIIMRKIIELVNPGEITTIITSHQDPDVCGNLPVVEDVINNPDLKIVAHGNTIRLIRHYGIRSTCYAVEDHDYRLTLQSGRSLEFLHTPYLHSPGAIATYDSKTRSLFTSDIFGAISTDWSLFATGDYLRPMKAWHQAYMPSNRLLAACMSRFEQYTLDKILPQHGSILENDQIGEAIQYLKDLPCGQDLNVV
jgi:flavorubredoxin